MPYPSLALEYARFQSKVNADFARWRYDLMKELHPQAWITTNFQSSRATHTDIFEMGQYTDVYGTNFYPTITPNLPWITAVAQPGKADHPRAALRFSSLAARHRPWLDAPVDLPLHRTRRDRHQLLPLAHRALGA
jgi:hypothetical protein